MALNIQNLGKQIVNPIVGLYLEGKSIPKGSKGEITEIYHQEEKVQIRWNLDEKTVTTYLTFADYFKLYETGMLTNLLSYIEPPLPQFNIGDIVEGCAVAGIIKNRRYNGVDNTWLYTLVTLEGIFSDNYDFRYSVEEEKYLKKLEGEVLTEIDLFGKVYEVKVSEKLKG